MALVPYSITALAESDADGTNGKNIVAGATVQFFDAETGGTAQTLYDDAASSNPSTTKTTGADGQVVVFIDQGLYWVSLNAGSRTAVTIDNPSSVVAGLVGQNLDVAAVVSKASFNETFFVRNFDSNAGGAAAHYFQIGALDGTTPTASARMTTVADFSGAGTGTLTFDVLNAGTMSTGLSINSAQGIRFNAYGAGTLQTDVSGNVTASSAEELKDIEGNYTAGLGEILKVNPITYKWKEETGLDRSHSYSGFGAGNLQDAGLSAAVYGEGEKRTVSDRPIIAALVNAIKELTEEINQLKNN